MERGSRKLNEECSKLKGIILAGGSGTRLYPSTQVISKQLLPIYNKPMIYYPLSILMHSDIKEILIISTPQDIGLFKKLLKKGNQFGIKISYAVQKKPNGLAEALIIGEKFLNNESCCLILGDNIFYGPDLNLDFKSLEAGAKIFLYQVSDPERYGVVELGKNKSIKKIVEKPKNPKSNLAVTGLYVYDNKASKYAKKLRPSKRGEKEITDLNNIYLKHGKLRYEKLPKGFAWLDTGTHNSLIEASSFIQTIENRQGIQVACLEEIALKKKWINKIQVKKNINKFVNSEYYNKIL